MEDQPLSLLLYKSLTVLSMKAASINHLERSCVTSIHNYFWLLIFSPPPIDLTEFKNLKILYLKWSKLKQDEIFTQDSSDNKASLDQFPSLGNVGKLLN